MKSGKGKVSIMATPKGIKTLKMRPAVLERAKVAYVKYFDKDYNTQDQLAEEIFEMFIKGEFAGRKSA